MREKQSIQYVRFSKLNASTRKGLGWRKKYVEASMEHINGLAGICVRCRIDIKNDNNRNNDIIVNAAQKILDKYDTSDAVIYVDPDMAQYMGMEDVMFRARKYEFTNNCEYIIGRMQSIYGSSNSVTLVIDSVKWDRREIFNILTAVKNCYRHINILTSRDELELQQIAETMYDEWGVVINIYSLRAGRVGVQDMVIFLVKQWSDSWDRRLSYYVSYIVEDVESVRVRLHDRMGVGSGIIRSNDTASGERPWRRRFSGLIYKADNELPYGLAVNLAWQKPVIFEKLCISMIDICEF